MKQYELIHEIYDLCSGKPETVISEIQTEDLDHYMNGQLSSAAVCEKVEKEDGSMVYEVITNGLKEHFVFTKI